MWSARSDLAPVIGLGERSGVTRGSGWNSGRPRDSRKNWARAPVPEGDSDMQVGAEQAARCRPVSQLIALTFGRGAGPGPPNVAAKVLYGWCSRRC